MEILPFFTTPAWIGSLGLDLSKIKKSCREFSSKVETMEVSNVGGYQGHDFDDQDFINAVVSNIPRLENKPLSNERIYSWVNINKKGDSNRRHTHLDTQIFLSGIYYVKVPENPGNVRFYDPRGCLIPSMQDHDYFNNGYSYHFLEPQEDMVVFFPCWLEHDVEPNESNQDRISIAFNVYADFEKMNPI
jgi:hypothetical protein